MRCLRGAYCWKPMGNRGAYEVPKFVDLNEETMCPRSCSRGALETLRTITRRLSVTLRPPGPRNPERNTSRSQKPTPRDFMPPPPHAPFEHFILNATRLRVREAIHKVRAMRRVGQGTG